MFPALSAPAPRPARRGAPRRHEPLAGPARARPPRVARPRPRGPRFALAGLLTLAALAVAAPPAHAVEQLLDTIVATVEGRIITLGDIEAEAYVTLALRAGGQAAEETTIDDAFRAQVLELLVSQEVVHAEALRLEAASVDAALVDAETRAFVGRFSSEPACERFLARLGLDRAALRQRIARTLAVDRFLRTQQRLIVTEPTPRELRAFYEQHRAALAGRPFEQVREAIAERLRRDRAEQALERWVSELRGRSEIRVLHRFVPLSEEARDDVGARPRLGAERGPTLP